MNSKVHKELVRFLQQVLAALKEDDLDTLKKLSNQATETVALYKDMDAVSVAVLLYSLFKVSSCWEQSDKDEIVTQLKIALTSLQKNSFGKYNGAIKKLFSHVKSCSAKVKDHLSDVMQAARIKKSTILFQKGLSIGQAAGLMGLSNWDLQIYAADTLSAHTEKIHAESRVKQALHIFGAT